MLHSPATSRAVPSGESWRSTSPNGSLCTASFERSSRSMQKQIQQWAAIPLRLIVGYGFMAHGYAKLAHGPEHFIAILQAMQVPAPALMGWATILVELIGGAAVLAGAFVPLVSLPMVVILIVAA